MRFRPEAEIWPIMSDDALKALAEDIDQHGQIEPISLYEGEILDGRNRWLAVTKFCKEGRTPKVEDVNPASPISFVLSLNEQRRHLNDDQRAMAGARALPFFEAEAKKRQIEAAIQRERDEKGKLKSAPPGALKTEPHRATDDAAKKVGASARGVQRAKRVTQKGSKKLQEAIDLGELSLGKAEEIVKSYPDKRTQDTELKHIRESRMTTRVKGLTGEIEWYTPRRYLDAAVTVMGAIDLDPASSDDAQRHVQADRWFTMADNGLIQQWSGRVFLNPPYAMPLVERFVNKLVESYENGEVSQAILLTNNATDTKWWHAAARSSTKICATRGRISFLQVRDGEMLEKKAPTHGQTFFYFGPDGTGFESTFGTYGIILTPDGS